MKVKSLISKLSIILYQIIILFNNFIQIITLNLGHFQEIYFGLLVTMPSIGRAIHPLFDLLVTLCFFETFVVFCHETENNVRNTLTENEITPRTSCQSFYWAHNYCNYFDPVCSFDGKVYKNRCILKEALCNNSSSLIQRNSQQSLKGSLDTRKCNNISNNYRHLLDVLTNVLISL